MEKITLQELNDALGFNNKKYNTVKYTREEKFSIRTKLKDIKKKLPSMRRTFFPDQMLLDVGIPGNFGKGFAIYYPLRIYKTDDCYYGVSSGKQEIDHYYKFDSWQDVQDNCERILMSMIPVSDIVKIRQISV